MTRYPRIRDLHHLATAPTRVIVRVWRSIVLPAVERGTLNLSRRKRPHIGVVWKLGAQVSSSSLDGLKGRQKPWCRVLVRRKCNSREKVKLLGTAGVKGFEKGLGNARLHVLRETYATLKKSIGNVRTPTVQSGFVTFLLRGLKAT
ncbi:hypothetical protein TNCV_4279111 [Trichonephila clavipes]|nr:hypothetical protein TNCV_4279111 [Trichonephila clavipes]